MEKSNPFIFSEALNPRLHNKLIGRQDLIRDIEFNISNGEYCLLLGPRYCGRTTILRVLESKYRTNPNFLPIIIQPIENLNLTSEAEFFTALGDLIERKVRGKGSQRKIFESKLPQIKNYGLNKFPDRFSLYINELMAILPYNLILFFDNIEFIPPNFLIRLANIAHAIFNERVDKSKNYLKKISFNFAGALPLRHLTAVEQPHLSPFNVCETIIITDLNHSDSIEYFRTINENLKLSFLESSIFSICEYAGGDLNMIQKIASICLKKSGNDSQIDKNVVEEAAEFILKSKDGGYDDNLRYSSLMVENHQATLELVARMLRKGFVVQFRSDDVDIGIFDAFNITYQEISGALILERDKEGPSQWRFRNLITEKFFKQYMTTNRIIRAFSALGDFDRAIKYSSPLLSNFRKEFNKNPLNIDEGLLKDLLIALTNRIYLQGAHEFGYKFISKVLKEAFNCTDVIYWDYQPNDSVLRAVKFLSNYFKNDGKQLDLNNKENKDILEVRAFKSKAFTINTGERGEVRIAIPLLNISDDATGVITIISTKEFVNWSYLGIRVQIIERALRIINIALNKVELDSKKSIISSAKTLQQKRKKIDVFIAQEFNRELIENLRDHLGRASDVFEFRYVDEKHPLGYLYSEIKNQMKLSDLALYEMSFPNNNVYFELGLGISINLPGFMFTRNFKDSKNLPPLLRGISYFEYNDYQSIIENINLKIKNVLRRRAMYRSEQRFIHFLQSNLPKARRKKQKYVAVADHNYFGDQRDFRKTIERLLKPANYDVVYVLDQNIQRKNYLKYDQEPDVTYPLIEIYNLLRLSDVAIIRVEKTIDDPISAQVFIILGLIIGYKKTDYIITSLKNDFSGEIIKVPSDIRALNVLKYHSFNELTNELTKDLNSKGLIEEENSM